MKPIFLSALLLSTTIITPVLAETLTRVATVPLGSEITGMYVEGSDLFFNVQHPMNDLPNAFSKASVGVISNFNRNNGELAVPEGDAKNVVTSSMREYQILIQEGDFGRIGVISGPGGTIKTSNDPDFNAFVRTDENEGYLFTNWED